MLTADDVDAALAQVGPEDWLLLQNEINDLPAVLASARKRGCRVAFNVAPVDGREADYDLSGVGLLIVNEIEAAALAGETEPRRAAAALAKRYPEADVVLTLGRDGLIHRRGDHESTLAAYAATAVDETAAGDAFIGFFLASLLAGDSMPEALRAGAAAGALAVTVAGAASSIPTSDDVRRKLAPEALR